LLADTDLDEVIVSLWDAGLQYIEDASSFIRPNDLRRARYVLGVEDVREQLSVSYWMTRSGLSRDELGKRLTEVAITLDSNSRRIPKNSLRRLRALFGGDEAEAKPPDVGIIEPQGPILPPLIWETIGSTSIRRYLEEDELESIHEALVEDFKLSSDPIAPPGVRDKNLLSSARSRPQTSNGDFLKYPTAEMAAAAMFHSIVQNHAFFNGNKRTGIVALLAYLEDNGLVLTCTENALFREALLTAQHGLLPPGADDIADREVLEVSRWIRASTRPLGREERPMKWHKLKGRLRELGCYMEKGAGIRLDITRTIETRDLFGLRRKRRELRTQVSCPSDGDEASKATIHKIRKDLALDDANGVDSGWFYEGAKIDAFIIEYRGVLKRLAKL
jgi:death-on-curing protein